jgi:Family of unknown function (DUF5681)
MSTSSETKSGIGYGRPPEHSKWKKGQCGNPKRIRKRRDTKPVATMIDEFFAREVSVDENGISHRRTAFEIIYLQLCNKAMTGNTRALNVLKKYSDFAASRAPSGGMRLEIIDEEPRPKNPGGENG